MRVASIAAIVGAAYLASAAPTRTLSSTTTHIPGCPKVTKGALPSGFPSLPPASVVHTSTASVPTESDFEVLLPLPVGPTKQDGDGIWHGMLGGDHGTHAQHVENSGPLDMEQGRDKREIENG